MKKINYIILVVVMIIILLGVEVIIVKSASKYEPKATVVYARVGIPAKTEISAEMLEEKKIAISLAHKHSFRNIKEVVGKKAKIDIEEGEMLLTGKILELGKIDEIRLKDTNNRLFTVEFKADQANGWRLEEDQCVDIIFVANEKVLNQPVLAPGQQNVSNTVQIQNNDAEILTREQKNRIKRLNNVRIAALIDEKGNLLKDTGGTVLPKYISFELTEGQDEFLAYAKGNGRLELSVIPSKD